MSGVTCSVMIPTPTLRIDKAKREIQKRESVGVGGTYHLLACIVNIVGSFDLMMERI